MESVLLYDVESWSLKNKMRVRLDGTYRSGLWAIIGISGKEYKTKIRALREIAKCGRINRN